MVIVGHSSHYNTHVAVKQAAANFRVAKPLFLFVLSGGRHAGESVLEQLAKLFPGVPAAGGSVAGTITEDTVDHGGFGVSIMAFLDPDALPRVLSSDSRNMGDFDRACELGRRVVTQYPGGRAVLLLYDSVRENDPISLHVGSFIAAGFKRGLGQADLRFVGAGLITSRNFDNAWLYSGRVLRHSIIALIFPSGVVLESFVLPGSRPTGLFAQITAIQGAEIAELDGRRAYAVMCEALGRDPISEANVLALNVSLGHVNRLHARGGSLGRNRLILTENRERGTITLFEPDFQRGDYVEILIQDGDYALQEARKMGALQQAAAYVEDVEFCIYLDCAGRSSAFTGFSEEESLVLMDGLPQSWPKIGGYTGVEIADIDGRYQALDLTGVLAVFRWSK